MKQKHSLVNNRHGEVLITEGEHDKETEVFTLDGKHITTLQEYWWDLDGINRALDVYFQQRLD